ncbi:hypothetical protein [Fundidesulfovibrio terrae]|uniref:hypothetical protein n=1 Tax=Fundidesulfovibrio terrae TaxID=2922866 RepID=UPI001FAF7D09|nr:hypothetical protein [Fundidesulfovibrio terrae]
MSLTSDDFLVNVPALHPETTSGTPQGVRFLNPGLPVQGEAGVFFRPGNLPMGEAVASAMLAQFAQLARESKRLGDISAFASGIYEDFHSGTSFAMRDEIRAEQSGTKAGEDARKALSKAQTELCLAWALEGVSLELAGLEEKLDGQWAVFEQSLGLEEDDTLEGEAAALTGAKPDLVPGGPRVPVPLLLASVLAFLPEKAGLFCADPAVIADWEEYGVTFAAASDATLARFGLTGSWREAVAPGHLLCLSKRPDPSKPWLDLPRLVVAAAGD